MSDGMELGNSTMVPLEGGGFLHVATGNIIDESGRVYDKLGNLVFDPTKKEENDKQEES